MNSCAANARSHTLLEAFLFCYGKNQDSPIAETRVLSSHECEVVKMPSLMRLCYY